MTDTIVYTYTAPKNEFHNNPKHFAATSRKDLESEVRGAWCDYSNSGVIPVVVNTLKEAKKALSSLTPTEKLCLSLHKDLIK